MSYRPQMSFFNAEDPAEYPIPNIEPAHFWSRSRSDIAQLRKTFIRQWLLASIELWIVIFLIVTLYFGTGHDPNRYTINLDVAIVDFDGDVAGRYFLNAFRQSAPGNSTLNWRYKGPDDYNNNVDDTRREVDDGYVWAIVVLRPHTTSQINRLLSAFLNTSTSLTSPFATLLPVLVTYEDGRNTFTVNNYVLPPIRSALAIASAQYSQMLRKELVSALQTSSNPSVNRNIQLSNALQLESLFANPLAVQYQNLHPGFPYVGQLASTLGYIYLYLISALTVGGAIQFLSVFGERSDRSNDLIVGFFCSSGKNLLYGFDCLSCFQRFFSSFHHIFHLFADCSLVLWYRFRQSIHALLDVQLAR